MPDYYLGLDLGKKQDYTALVVLTRDKAYREASEKRAEIERHYAGLAAFRGREGVEQLSPRLQRERDEALGRHPLPEERFVVRHAARFELGTDYSEIASRVRETIAAPPIENDYLLAVDETGVGGAVVEQLKARGIRFRGVTITGGREEKRHERDRYSVPKKDLVARAQVLLQNGRLKIVPQLAHAQALINELVNFRVKQTAAGHESFEAWRENDHDDLVFALCLAAWLLPKGNLVEIPADLVESFDIFAEERRRSGYEGRPSPEDDLVASDGFGWGGW